VYGKLVLGQSWYSTRSPNKHAAISSGDVRAPFVTELSRSDKDTHNCSYWGSASAFEKLAANIWRKYNKPRA